MKIMKNILKFYMDPLIFHILQEVTSKLFIIFNNLIKFIYYIFISQLKQIN